MCEAHFLADINLINSSDEGQNIDRVEISPQEKGIEIMIYDVIIIGSGPAGLSAAIYAQRARLKCLVIEKEVLSGGQIINTTDVDNYPGMPGVSGFELGMKFREHAEKLGTEFVNARVQRVEESYNYKKIITDTVEYLAKTVILATGAAHRKLQVPGEEELTGMGVSYCATCDGAFFKNRITAVVGGGDVALEDALFLSRICEKVYLIHRREEFRGARVLQEQVFERENIELLTNSQITEIQGEEQVESIVVHHNKEEKSQVLAVNGVFVAVGIVPNTEIFQDFIALDEQGYITAGEDGVTSAEGVFAAGDVRTKPLRQVVTAAADGANCITSAEKYLSFHGKKW